MIKWKAILNAGSIAGLVSYGLFLVYFYLFNANPLGPIKWLGIWVPAVFMYIGIKKYREQESEGFIKYGPAFLAGFFFSFIYASLSAMLIYLHAMALDASYVDVFIMDNLKTLGETKEQLLMVFDRDQYEEMLNQIKGMTPGQLALSDFQSKLIGSAIMALIIAGILKKNPPTLPFGDGQA